MATQYVDIPFGEGVTSLNGLTGALTLLAGTNITITSGAGTITISATGSGIASINGDTTAAQTLSVGTAGTDFAITNPGGGSHVFNLPTASASNRGALSSADWSTFNAKQPAGSYITALTGDGTATGPGSAAFTLATVNANVGTFTNATITVNAKGLITAASTGTGLVATTTKTSNYTILSTDSIIFADTSGGGFTLTLPSPSGLAGKIYRIIDSTGFFQTNNLTLAPSSTELIEGLASSKPLQTPWGWFTVTTDGTNWFVGG